MNKTEKRIAAGVIAMVIASLFLVMLGMQQERKIQRVSSLRSVSVEGAEHLAVVLGDTLRLLDASGRQIVRQPLSELGLSEAPNDMDWVQAADGSTEAWFFDDTVVRLVRCRLDTAAQRLAPCTTPMSGTSLKINSGSMAVHIAVDPKGERVFIADAKGHGVRVLNFQGQVLATSAEGVLFFPNRLRWLPEGQLVVADNDNRRLVWLDVSKAVPDFSVTRTLNAADHPNARPGHTKVADFAFSKGASGQRGALWMLAVAQGQKNGDVLVYGDDLKPLKRADLGGASDPLVIDTLGGTLVAADYSAIDLYRVGSRGEFLGPFGDATFRGELIAEGKKARQASVLIKTGWGGFVLTFVLGLLLTLKYGQRPKAPVPPAQRPALDVHALFAGVKKITLSPEPWFVRQTQWGLWLTILILPLFLAVMVWGFPHEVLSLWNKLNGLTQAKLALGFLIPLGMAIGGALRLNFRRVVITPNVVQILHAGKVLAATPWADVMASPDMLLVGRVTLQIQRRRLGQREGKWIYDEAKMNRYLLDRLSPDQRVTRQQLMTTSLRRLPRWQKVMMVLALLMTIALVLWPNIKGFV